MQRIWPVFGFSLLLLASCKRDADLPPAAPDPRVFGPNEIRPKIIFVGDWAASKREFLNLQLEVAKSGVAGPQTLTNAEVTEDSYPTVTAVFMKDLAELERKQLSSERSC